MDQQGSQKRNCMLSLADGRLPQLSGVVGIDGSLRCGVRIYVLVPEARDIRADAASSKSVGIGVSNIAEGAGRSTDADFARHLSYALGSINEVECQMLIARRRNYISEKTLHNVEQLVRSSRRLTTRLRQSVADSS